MLLNCHTYYSFCYGTFSTEELLDHIKSNGYTSFVLSDINNTSACLDAVRMAAERGLKPILGIDFRNGTQQQYVGIAMNNEGFRELNEHLSQHLHQAEDFQPIAPPFRHAYIIYPSENYKNQTLAAYEFIGISVKTALSLPFSSFRKQMHKLVVLQPVTFADKSRYNAHRLLRAIDKNTLLSKLPKTEQAEPDEMLMPRQTLYALYSNYPAIISTTERLLSSCSIEFVFDKFANKNLTHYTGSMAGDIACLRRECETGIKYRYPEGPSAAVTERIEKEFRVIEQMNFASYFLINWNIIQYARHKNYYYVGRGSGANSMLAYLLRITDVDPIELDLYFERFINPHRSNPPDFDLDFSWTDRDDMTRYIFDTFGRQRTALVGAYNTFQKDAVIRELGKVFGLPPGEIDKLQIDTNHAGADELGKLVIRYSRLIQGFPSHLSVHSSGILISQEPISCYTATNMPPKGYPTTQFSMLEAEDIGLCKFDILSQRGLGKIKDSLQLIKDNKNVDIDIHNIARFKEDEKIKELLREGKTIGCFYVESPAMRVLLAKLQADDYLRLVAASSIIRPGVSKSGMMREYILRFRDLNRRKTAREQLPELYDLLQETYGVMVYQEDVIKVGHLFAGLSLAEADYLRRGMSWKFKQRNEFALVREKFFTNCRLKNHSEKAILEIWTQIESFANYAFSKGHSASYAVESYQALFLKAHFPLEYMVATLNNGGGFYRKDLYVHEARMNGARIEAPCVNNSDALCTLRDKTIYLGLGLIAELEDRNVQDITRERKDSGPYKNMSNFLKRVPLSIDQTRLLIRAGSFRFSNPNKKELMWEIHSLINPLIKKAQTRELFDIKAKAWKLPPLTNNRLDNAFDELQLLGFPLCSPFELLKEKLPLTITSKQLAGYIGKTITIVGYLVTIKYTRTSKGDLMYFGTFTDTEGNWVDTVHFPPSAHKYPFTGPGCYLLTGKVTEEYDFTTIEVSTQKRLPMADREHHSEETTDSAPVL
jgi:DNA polymerase-3 subunit alpha